MREKIQVEETTVIYFVRHGETTANATNTLQGQSDVPLNEKGIKQAELAAGRLREKHFDLILSSDLSRAAATAQAIAGERKISYSKLLREWDLGEWVGLNWTQIAEKFPQESAAFSAGDMDAAVPGGESRRQFYDRAQQVLQWLTEEFRGKTLLCVSHGGFLRAVFRVASGLHSGFKNVRTDNTCICCIKYHHTSKEWQLVTWNDIAHLEGQTLSTGW